jgi:ABC-type Mn2+/Zn2+ transport system ATPase subunit
MACTSLSPRSAACGSPPAQFSPVLRHVAEILPSYNLADLGWRVAGGDAPSLGACLALAGWTAAFTVIALAAGVRRPRRHAGDEAPDPRADAAVCARGLSKRYGSVRALDGIDLRVRRGDTVALPGANGAGKSTTIELLLGLLDTDHGSVRLFGAASARAIAAGWVGAMLQDTELMAGVRVGDLLRAIRGVYPTPANLPELIDVAGSDELRDRRTDQLSAGQSQRVRFALAASGDPQLLVLDEPTVAMDVEAREAFWIAVQAYAQNGKTILFSTHYLEGRDHTNRAVPLATRYP